uniref:Eukaryotic translation initiation factor 3 subunit I n=1 Tax=Brassica campestris TaxID=3711 RepID=M4EW29_BRACM
MSSTPDITGILENTKELDRLRKEQEEVLVEVNKIHKKLRSSPEVVEKPGDTSLSQLKNLFIQAKELSESEVTVSNIRLAQLDSLLPSGQQRGKLEVAEGNGLKRKRMKAGSDVTRVPPSIRNQMKAYASLKGEQVAARMTADDAEQDEWLVVKVIHFDRETKDEKETDVTLLYDDASVVTRCPPDRRVEVLDEESGDDEEGGGQRTYKLPMSCILPFPKRNDPSTTQEFLPGKHVLAVYPGTTALYKATVVSTPRKRKSDEYLLEFDDDEENGALPQRTVPFHKVVALPEGHRQSRSCDKERAFKEKMRPILMKGHERPLTFLRYNRDGDMLFSCAKDHTPTLWYADNGERHGTFRGHNGAVWCCDVSRDSLRLITGSADQSAKLWDVKTGQQLFSFKFGSPARSVDFALGDKLAVITTDPFMERTSAIHVKRIAEDPEDQVSESVLVLESPNGRKRINRAVWGPLNQTIVSGGEDAVLRIWDAETGKLLKESDSEVGHKNTITSLTKSADDSHFITGSLDKTAKACLWDMRTLTLLKTYVSGVPVNAVSMSPLLDHVVLGGGQDASAVTTTDHRAGKFEAKFYDKILQEEIGGVKGHFGPINALAFNPDGKSFSSGGEDGYVRLHHFDSDYFNIRI